MKTLHSITFVFEWRQIKPNAHPPLPQPGVPLLSFLVLQSPISSQLVACPPDPLTHAVMVSGVTTEHSEYVEVHGLLAFLAGQFVDFVELVHATPA